MLLLVHICKALWYPGVGDCICLNRGVHQLSTNDRAQQAINSDPVHAILSLFNHPYHGINSPL